MVRGFLRASCWLPLDPDATSGEVGPIGTNPRQKHAVSHSVVIPLRNSLYEHPGVVDWFAPGYSRPGASCGGRCSENVHTGERYHNRHTDRRRLRSLQGIRLLAGAALVTRAGRAAGGGGDDGGRRSPRWPSRGSLGHAGEETGGYTCGLMGRVSEEERNEREKEERKLKRREEKEQREEEICKLKARQDPDG